MTKIIENQDKCIRPIKSKKVFFSGIVIMLGSSAYGWIGLFWLNAKALLTGKYIYTFMSLAVYAVSWITFGLGFLMAGREGIRYTKGFYKKFRLKKSKKEEIGE